MPSAFHFEPTERDAIENPHLPDIRTQFYAKNIAQTFYHVNIRIQSE